MTLAAVRRFHSWFGVFIAPSILFFALTGSLQLFTLHEAHGDYHPPAVIEKLGMLHKDQVFEAKPKRSPPPAAQAPKPAAPAAAARHEDGPKTSTLALKWFFLFVAASLAVSTCLGLWMALTYSADKRVLWLLFLAGAAVPLAILLA
nr:hypothetical protein [Phenylobacterium sp.]